MAQPAGDTNGDGAADLWVPGFDLSMHLFLGPIPAILDPAAAAASVALESYRNWSLADLNGDGSVDALFADTQFDGAYLVPGPLTGALDATDASFHLQDSNCENVYAEDLGDTDGDGVHEIYIGVPASGYCYGSAQVGTIIAADYIGENELNGFASATARVVGGARHVRAAGDLNGDGNADVAIVGADPAAGVTVVFGPVAGDLDPSSVGDVRWTHPTAYPYDAVSVGDLDADGLGELAVLYFDNQTMEFNVYVVPGGRTGTWDVTPEWTLVGGARHVNDLHLSAGDVDGDGISDLVASVPGDVIFASLGVHY
jgi:hypothetical protein